MFVRASRGFAPARSNRSDKRRDAIDLGHDELGELDLIRRLEMTAQQLRRAAHAGERAFDFVRESAQRFGQAQARSSRQPDACSSTSTMSSSIGVNARSAARSPIAVRRRASRSQMRRCSALARDAASTSCGGFASSIAIGSPRQLRVPEPSQSQNAGFAARTTKSRSIDRHRGRAGIEASRRALVALDARAGSGVGSLHHSSAWTGVDEIVQQRSWSPVFFCPNGPCWPVPLARRA